MTDAPKKKSKKIWEFLLIFIAVYLLSDLAFKYFFPEKPAGTQAAAVTMEPQSSSFRMGHQPVLIVTNSTDKPYAIPSRCPQPPVDVFAVEGSGSLRPLTTSETAVPCVAAGPVAPGSSASIDLAPWKYSLFGNPGTYEVHLPAAQAGLAPSVTTRFAMHEPGFIVKTFRTFITKPFLNFLILVASALPDHNLGIAIIVLTLLVKLVLYFPTQHAMEGQRKMQLIQPKLQELQKRFASDPQALHKETMALWRAENVNPFQSILPLLLQFPILIGLFFVIRDGSNLALSREFIYSFYQHLTWNFNTWFAGIDLTKPNWIFPPLLMALQAGQMWLSFQHASKKQAQPVDAAAKMQQRVMLVAMPLLIGFFAFQFPAAVSLYWAVSTLFAVGQQWVVNRKVG